MPTPIIMPQLGESVVEGTVMTWLKQPGEAVAEFEPLVEINTDKVATEIPSPASGVLLAVRVTEGETVPAGTLLAWVGAPDETPPESETPPAPHPTPAEKEAAPAPTAQPEHISAGRSADLGFISPVVARIAHEHQIDLTQVTGSGHGGRITKQDVLAYLERAQAGAPPAWETPGDGDLFRPSELSQTAPPQPPAPLTGDRIPHTLMRKAIAANLTASSRDIPQVTTFMEADLSAVVRHRAQTQPAFEREGLHLTYTPYFLAAAAAALRAFPAANASWSEEALLLHPSINIGVAVALGDAGLIVPVIHQADERSLAGLARSLADLTARARANRLQPQDVQGGTFTISNHGITGSLYATPLVNPPQCAILGVGAVQKRVVVLDGDAIAVRPMLVLSLSFDHRILDGASADRFLAQIVQKLQRWPEDGL